MEEINPVVLGKYDLEYQEKLKGFLWSFSTVEDYDARVKIIDF